MIKVVTETGSVYMFDMENLKMQRLDHTNKSQDLRKDGEWLQMLLEPGIEVGRTMAIPLAPLAEGFECTMRFTSTVLSAEEV